MSQHPPTPPAGGAGPDGSDEALHRLRAADPASSAHPDGDVLRVAVDERIAAGRTDQLAAARARRWTSWPARVAGVAAAALVVGGGGGYAIGASGHGAQTTADAGVWESVGNAGDAAGGFDSDGQGGFGGPQSMPAGPMAGTAESMDRAWGPGYGGRTLFTSSGLSSEAGVAPAWAFDPSAAFTEQSVSALAAALGVPGAPVLRDGFWMVGPNDGSGANVSLYPDGTASVNYYDPSKDPWACAYGGGVDGSTGSQEAEEDAKARETQIEPDMGMVAPDACEQRDLGSAPVGDEALAAAREILAAVGQDPAGFELSAENWGDPSWTYVNAIRVIEGSKSSVTWNFSFTGAGLHSLYGSLAPLVPLGDYDVVSPQEAVERLTDPRFGAGWGGPIAWAEGADGAEGLAVPEGDVSVGGFDPAGLPRTVQPGEQLGWPVSEVHIVEARLASTMHYQPDGAVVLVPAYELVGSDGGIWSVVAVADRHLDFGAR